MLKLTVATRRRMHKFPDNCLGIPLMGFERKRKWSLRGVFGWFSF